MNLYLGSFTLRGKQFLVDIIRHESGEKAAAFMLDAVRRALPYETIDDTDVEITLLSADGPIGRTDYLALITNARSINTTGW